MAFGNEYSLIGVDVGDTSVKIVQLKAGRNGEWRLHAVAQNGYSPPGTAGSTGADSSACEETVRRMLSDKKFVGRKMATVLPRTDVLIRPVKLAPELCQAGPGEIQEALQSEARRYLSYPPEEAVLDFLTVGGMGDSEEENLQVLLVSAKEERVHQHLALLESAGLHCACIDIVPCAVHRAAARIIGADCEDAIVTVEIGERASIVGISQSGKLLFSRCFNQGSAMLTDALVTELGLSPEKAEMFKRSCGIDHRADATAELWKDVKLSPDATSGIIFDMCRDQLKNFAYEMKRSIDYFITQFRMIRVEKAILFGGGAALKGLPEYLSEQTRLEVCVGDPFAPMAAGNGCSDDVAAGAAPSFAVALGLALHGERQ